MRHAHHFSPRARALAAAGAGALALLSACASSSSDKAGAQSQSAPADTPAAAVNGPIAFQRFAGPREDDHSSQIYTRSAAGVERKLTTFSSGAVDPAWSPDSSRIAFGRIFLRTHKPDQLYTMAATGGGVRKLTSGCGSSCLGDIWPQYSPKGDQISFIRALNPLVDHRAGFDRYQTFGRSQIMLVPAGGGAPKVVREFGRDPSIANGGADWSPDGKQLVVALESSKHPNTHTHLTNALFVLGADGSGLRRITPWALGATDPDWSPDGKLIVFNSQGGHSQGIHLVRPDGSGRRELLRGNDRAVNIGPVVHPSWSPDGTQIVFAARGKIGNLNRSDIYAMNADGSNIHKLFGGPRFEAAPVWGTGR
jgi:Tol biopolymer transport system component